MKVGGPSSRHHNTSQHMDVRGLCDGFGSNAISLMKFVLCLRGALAVVCVLMATGSCYELLLSRGERTKNQTADLVPSNQKAVTSLGKYSFS